MREHAAVWCDHLAVKDSEIVSSDDDGVALEVEDGGGEGDVAWDLHCRSYILHSLVMAVEDQH